MSVSLSQENYWLQSWGYAFYDLDEEVKKFMGTTLEEFVHTGTLFYRDQVRCQLINTITQSKTNIVLSVTPLSYPESIRHLFSSEDVFAIELQDSVQNIYDRLVFSDENDHIYKDDAYRDAHRDHYLSEIQEDIDWYGSRIAEIRNKFDMDGNPPEMVVDQMIKQYHLIRNETMEG
jgi:shikimate kinase